MAKRTKFDAAIEKRQEDDKKKFIESLREFPVIEYACKKTGIGRTTYYRWKGEDTHFANKSDEAWKHGIELINDMNESQLIALGKEKKMSAIAFWLKHNSLRYRPQPMWRTQEPPQRSLLLEVVQKIQQENQEQERKKRESGED